MGTSTRLLWVGIAAAAVSYFYGRFLQNKSKDVFSVEQAILDAWNRVIEKPSIEFKKILVGINCNVDLIIGGAHLMTNLNIQPGQSADHESINTFDEFQQAFSYFFAQGVPGERFVANREVFHEFVKVAEKDPTAEFQVGGNAALIAQKIAASYSNSKVLLVGPIGPRLKALLHPNVLTQNSTKISKDQIHLIMEYRQGQIWGEHVSPSSSRFITSHDNFSSSAVVIDMFFNSILTTKPDLIVLSGVHLLEFQPKELWQEKLKTLKRYLQQVNRLIPVHLELGGMANKEFAKTVLHRIVPYVDSLGMNEQELMFLSQVGKGPYADQFPISGGSLHTHKTTEILNWLMTSFGRNPKNPDSKKIHFRLQRIHFHCLTYHMIVTRGPDWSNSVAALSAGAKLAGQQACHGLTRMESDFIELRISKEFLVDSTTEKMYKLNPHNPIYSWMRNDVLFLISPVLVCKQPQKTVGLGDAITASGLMYSQFYRFDK